MLGEGEADQETPAEASTMEHDGESPSVSESSANQNSELITETDENSTPMTVQGKLIGYNGGILFMSFTTNESEEENICLFRAHRIFFDQKRVQPHEVKNKERVQALVEAKIEGNLLNARVEQMEKEDALYKTMDDVEIRPKWYSHCVWLGEEPTEQQRAPSVNVKANKDAKLESQNAVHKRKQSEESQSEENLVKAQTGMMVCHNLSGSGVIKFDLNGQTQHALFYTKVFLQDGVLIKSADFRTWKMDHTMEVNFNAHKVSNLQSFTARLPATDTEMESEVMYLPTWRCSVVWAGTEPTSEMIHQVQTMRRGKKQMGDTLVKEHDEYVCGPLTHFVDRSTGLIQGKNVAVLFKMQDLVIDGVPVDANSRLSSLCQVGDVLFSHVKPLVPARTIGDVVCDRIAVEIWKGKKHKKANTDPVMETVPAIEDESGAVATPSGSKKHVYPMPGAATHFNQSGIVTEVQNVLGKIKLSSSDPELNGKIVLLSKNRLFINGQRIRFKEFLTNNLQVGERLSFDMVRADEEESLGEYEWLALLAWKTEKPSTEQVKIELGTAGSKAIWRAKILKFDERDHSDGFRSGVLQIVSGPSNLGERVIFHREHTYVFGARMAKADLFYVMKENDKVQLDFEVLEAATVGALEQKYGCEIKYRANMVWIGPMPRLEEDCDRFPDYMGGAVLPFLQKRQMDEELFTRLIQGKMKPKEYSPSPADRHKEKLPPNQIMAKVSELKRPDFVGTFRGTTHGVMTLENGPMAGQKTFFARSHITIFGHSMSKADLMYVVKESDRFFVEVRTGTNNKNVPNVLVSAWIGQQPSDKNKAVPADTTNVAFRNWLEEHEFTDFDRFKQCVSGELPPKPFHPLPLEVQIGRITYLYPHNKVSRGSGTDAGIIKIHQGSMAKRDVLFERENVFIWGINFKAGDVAHVLKEGDKVMVEVIEISGKERKKRQAKLGTSNIPKYVATLVYIGGGRPKPHDSTKEYTMEELNKNQNIKQWLNKRGKDVDFFADLMAGQLLPKVQPQKPQPHPFGRFDDFPQQTQPSNTFMGMHGGHTQQHQGSYGPGQVMSAGGDFRRDSSPVVEMNTMDRRESSFNMPLGRPPATPMIAQQPPAEYRRVDNSEFSQQRRQDPQGGCEMVNPVMFQAQQLLKRVMGCTSHMDDKVDHIVEEKSQVQLALFISKTLEVAAKRYQEREQEQQRYRDPGPIGPPKRKETFSMYQSESSSFQNHMGETRSMPSSASRLPAEGSIWNSDRFSANRDSGDVKASSSYEPDFGTRRSYEDSRHGSQDRMSSSSLLNSGDSDTTGGFSRRFGGLFGLQQPLPENEEEEDIGIIGEFKNGVMRAPSSSSSLNPWETTNVRRPQRRESPVEFSQATQYMEPPNKRFLPK